MSDLMQATPGVSDFFELNKLILRFLKFLLQSGKLTSQFMTTQIHLFLIPNPHQNNIEEFRR